MNRLFLTFTVFTCFSFASIYSQGIRNDKIEAEKVAFFTKRLDLSAQEAEKFWPVYNDFSSRKEKLTLDKNSLLRYLNQNFRNLSEEELKESSNKFIDFTIQQASLTKEYHEKFLEILTPSQVIRLYNAEVQYKTILLNQLQNRRANQQPARRRYQPMKPGN